MNKFLFFILKLSILLNTIVVVIVFLLFYNFPNNNLTNIQNNVKIKIIEYINNTIIKKGIDNHQKYISKEKIIINEPNSKLPVLSEIIIPVYYNNQNSEINDNVFYEQFKYASTQWKNACNINFKLINKDTPNSGTIYWDDFNNSDILGEAETPNITEGPLINFNLKLNTNLRGYDIGNVLTHELGHTLGFDHLDNEHDVMFEAYEHTNKIQKLSKNDINLCLMYREVWNGGNIDKIANKYGFVYE